jgi:hypothetical protein
MLVSNLVLVSRETYLFRTGQEVAPGRCCLVAVASSGLNPLPLSISAAGPRRKTTNLAEAFTTLLTYRL